MDLNKSPPEFDYDFLGESDANPLYCTQAEDGGCVGAVHDIEHIPEQDPSVFPVGNYLATVGNNVDEAAQNVQVNDENTQDLQVVEEIWSTPPVPYIGQTFSTKQEAREFYNSYAKRIGFSVRTGTSRLSSLTREQQKILFVCNKEGRGRKMKEGNSVVEYDDSDSTVRESEPENNDEGNDIENAEKKKKMDGGKKRKREKMHHTDCKARMIVKLIGDRWHVIFFAPDHNHDLVVKPSLKKFMRSHKGIPQAEKDFIEMLHGCNLSTGRIMQLMNEFYGSAQLVPYEAKDVGNFRSNIRRTEKFKDMQETLDYFRELEHGDAEFFHKIKLDAEHRVESLFWVDGAARHAYIESYHDCVSFDATYMTNMYDMPFAPFIGINRHGQSFMLGCAFLRDEKTPSYTWLFETFLEAMKGKAPVSIITDQDAAMRCEIAHVFPNTNHRNCRWHIMDKFTGTIGPVLDGDEELEEDFKECMNHTVNPQEFEEKWDAMINKHGLTDNVHFQRLYALRSSFAPAYYMHCFYPFLQSTQRSEGFNAVLKKYVNPNMSVLNFVKQYQKIQDKCLVAQDGQDFKTDDRDRRRWSRYPIEKYASTVYTKNLFYRFSKEFEKTAEYDVKPEGQIQYYLVPNNKFVYSYGKRAYLVTAIEDEESYYCECSKFDRDGLICCHIMKIMTRLGVKTIPNHFILKRWTQESVPENENGGVNANSHVQADFIARGMPLNNRKTMWFANLSTAFAGLAVEGSVSRETYDLMDSHIKMIRSALDEIKKRKRPSRQRVRANTQPTGGTIMPSVTTKSAADIPAVSAPVIGVHSAPCSGGVIATTNVLPTVQPGV